MNAINQTFPSIVCKPGKTIYKSKQSNQKNIESWQQKN